MEVTGNHLLRKYEVLVELEEKNVERFRGQLIIEEKLRGIEQEYLRFQEAKDEHDKLYNTIKTILSETVTEGDPTPEKFEQLQQNNINVNDITKKLAANEQIVDKRIDELKSELAAKSSK
jgi:hypothetical protein